jgi:hypothetical protein
VDIGFNWLRAELTHPLVEHLSFRIGNQIFFVFIEAAEFVYQNNKEMFDKACKEANAIPCIMPMDKNEEEWMPAIPGWGFIHPQTKQPLNPMDYVTQELIEMSDWELQDFAIQIVCMDLKKQGKRVYSKQSSPNIDPAIWFEDDNGENYVVVKSARHPAEEIPLPKNINVIKQGCSHKSTSGYFATVMVANFMDPFDPEVKNNGNFLPLYRGQKLTVKYKGLIVI